MSVLNADDEAVDAAEIVAQKIKQRARATFQNLVHTFNWEAHNFWRNSLATPAAIAAALGTDAKEVFELHGKIGALLGSVRPEDIAAGASVVGQFSYNQDGTVTIVEQTAPAEPEQTTPEESTSAP